MGPVTGTQNGRGAAPSPAEQVRGWVERSCAEQGLPSRVEDERVLKDIALLLGGGSEW